MWPCFSYRQGLSSAHFTKYRTTQRKYTASTRTMSTPLKQLQEILNQRDLAGYIVPSEDSHQSEYTPEADKRRAFISGFTGSMGTALVGTQHSYLWTDGRYWNQASHELDGEEWTLMKVGVSTTPTIGAFVAETFPEKAKIGVDPRLVSRSFVKDIQNILATKDQVLELIDENLVDKVWTDRPQVIPQRELTILSDETTGKSVSDKLTWLREQLSANKAYMHVVTALDAISWLFNFRGSDISYNPVSIAYAVVTANNAFIFIDPSKVTKEFSDHLQGKAEIKPYNDFFAELATLCSFKKGKAWVDPGSSAAVYKVCADAECEVLQKDSPITLAKALKNEAELKGMRNCAVRDAVALVRFFAWLENEFKEGRGVEEDEFTVSDKLLDFRKQVPGFVSESFGTISSVGANAAVIHYHPNKDTAAKMDPKQIYLCDSGGQYLDGTTDVTRTFHFGSPSEKEKEAFTCVMKGVIALTTVIFPENTTGLQLDILARQALWAQGLDYHHGTGHGIGHFLNVHEGPHGISFRIRSHSTPLQAGMTTSNEPGYYEDGLFGIRIENDMIITPVTPKYNSMNVGFLGFENITWVPIDNNLVEPSLLTPTEKDWINNYHKTCWNKVSPLIPKEDTLALDWLEKRTQPL